MNNNNYQNSHVWSLIIQALTFFVISREVKTDKKGREFLSFRFNASASSIKSVVAYITKKNDVRLLVNASISGKNNKFNKRFCYLLKNINKEEFFLICGKDRLANHNKKEFLYLLEEGSKPLQYQEQF